MDAEQGGDIGPRFPGIEHRDRFPALIFRQLGRTPEMLADGQVVFSPILQQHLEFVAAIKRNRAFANLDNIVSNNRKLNYECVWAQFDDRTAWLCIFALNIYDWKDLGSSTPDIPEHGCAGFYTRPDGSVPENAARDRASVTKCRTTTYSTHSRREYRLQRFYWQEGRPRRRNLP
jgi:hypothetical protein